ncbi:hypothetical protein [Pseudomonas sp. GZD-222]|uniref:hypothetical protein n=1 Tax=Pseudomonas sp. GZD-222 TaxID=3404805 RepID=UPI003BB506B1
MNRTLLLLNALALAVFVGLMAQPQDFASSSPTQGAPTMHPQRAVFDAGKALTPTPSLSLQPPPHQQERLSF